jgi:hypothetical protein
LRPATLAVVLYGLLYLPYGLFYARLGTSPAEVGLSQPEIIGQSIGGLALILLLPLWILGLPTLVLWALSKQFPRFRSDSESWRRWFFMSLPVVWVGAVAIFLPTLALQQAEEARAGRSPLVADIAVLGLRADAVELDWVATGPAPAVIGSDSLLFLGTNGGELILFDHMADRLVRLPANAVVVATDK